MLKKSLLKQLESSRKLLLSAKSESGKNMWALNLKGACNVSSILVYVILDKAGYKPTLVNNHKHCFNIIELKEKLFVVDLTATQINKSFNTIEVTNLNEIKERASLTKIGKPFYNIEAISKTKFFRKGTLKEVLKSDRRKDFQYDYINLFNILKKVIIVMDLKIEIIHELNADTVDLFAKNIIKELYIKEV